MFILLTGSRHAGKTTACWKALPGLRAAGMRIAGFVSPPILNGVGHKTGIEMVDLTTGQRQKFAQVAGPDETPTVGVYRVLDGATEWARGILAAALTANADWLVIDEIGPLELHHDSGFAFALEPLADPERIPNAIVIVRPELVGELAERLGRTDTVFVEVTEANRLEIPGQLVRLIQAARARSG
jgi:nucleoside-triphosphatase THEP1